MPVLKATIPPSLDRALSEGVARRGTSPDNLVGAALGEYLHSHGHMHKAFDTPAPAIIGVYVD